jgi:predicted kinase
VTLILVTGPPGSGKSTLASSLSRTLGCPLISRDEIREGIVLAGTPDPGTLHTYRVFTDTVTALALAGVTTIAEAAFQDHLWRPILEPLLPRVPIRVLRCRVPAEVAHTRITGRPVTGPSARAAHRGNPVSAGAWTPVTLDLPTLTVDTTTGYVPPETEIAAFATAHGTNRP